MAISKRKSELPAPQRPHQKTPQQLKQWDAYLALCEQREAEAQAKVAHLKRASELASQAGKHAQAQQIRQFAEDVLSRLDPSTSLDVRCKAEAWRQEVLDLAERIDPIPPIILGFSYTNPRQDK
ncbi:hypothetical protein H9K76_15450 [Diaphorobacter ruginosibacter]|uniref:Uncharacterized protein n=1 Tax=Diaphorobacter ruginosibacter TaxID=1715720 RepID=A0A7G9RK54_9BURK|nr:hypothetical protein [Diaphorobacter ruginosibacter]QNN55979.1 hypothetical protein H9K76_15450 [Diaphorobacter ruginosibacter]